MVNEAILKKLKNILAKTQKSGATEEEANAALKLAAKMADRYNIDLNTIDLNEDDENNPFAGRVVRTFKSKRSKKHEVDELLYALQCLFRVKVLSRKFRKGVRSDNVRTEWILIGHDDDIQAFYLTRKLMRRAMENEWIDHWNNNLDEETLSRYAFMFGMQVRWSDVIQEILDHRNKNHGNLPVLRVEDILDSHTEFYANTVEPVRKRKSRNTKRIMLTEKEFRDYQAGNAAASKYDLQQKVT